MKIDVKNLTIIVMVLLFLFGCSVQKKGAPLSKRQPEEKGAGAVESENSYYYFTESELYQKQGNLDKAIQSLDKAIQKDPGSAYLKLELAILYLRQKNNKKALDISFNSR